jgi:glucose/arabinose dehydrogenase
VGLPASVLCVVALFAGVLNAASAGAATLPTGFRETTVFSGLTNPSALRFAPDGRVFVAEKRGVIKVFDNLADTTPTTFADLRSEVYNFWDRGLLGLALDPGFPDRPYVYVLYTHDAPIGGTAPYWGTAGADGDPCPNPPGATSDGCVVSGRLSRLQASGNAMTGSEQVLIEDWCQQYPSHSIGDLAFGPDGALYAGAGDGASFNFTDYGQEGDPVNPCGDPPGGVGSVLSPPTAEGGALRSQDLRTSADPTTLDGTIVRVDPDTGSALSDNPLATSADANARRIIASGLRNPFRFAFRPGTSELWLGDVGWGAWEELDRITSPTDSVVENFGWPCYEGEGRQPGYDSADLSLCENLYGAGPNAVTAPYRAYNHGAQVVAGESCPTGSSSLSGLAFYGGGNYPADYDGALFFADYARDCIWAMQRDGTGSLPSPSKVKNFVTGAANPVDIEIGPSGDASGDLFYVDFDGGTIRRISYAAANQPPTAVATATLTSGPAPLTVKFDGRGSSDPESGDTLSYAWDLDADGAHDDSISATPSHTYTTAGVYTVSLKVTDSEGASSTATVTITADNSPPSATITAPSPTTTWAVGDTINFAGSATDDHDGSLPANSLSWSLLLHHCPSNCHTHLLQTWEGSASGSFPAADHEYPSHLELRLAATDSKGLTDTKSVRLDPKTVDITLQSRPTALKLSLNQATTTTPFTQTVIQYSTNTISAPSPQSKEGTSYEFTSWSNDGAQAHTSTANASTTYTATFSEEGQTPRPPTVIERPPASGAPTASATPPALVPPPAFAPIFGLDPVLYPTKMQVERAQVQHRERRLDVLAPITGRASGEVEVEFFAAQRRFTFREDVDSDDRRIKFRRAIPVEQARLGTGIMTINYPGDEDTRPQEVRLRAASQKADLELERPVIADGRLKAQGTISDRARGVVRLQLQYVVGGQTDTLQLRGQIDDGEWEIDEALTPEALAGIAQRTGSVHTYTLFTGYFPRRIRGEMQSYQVLGSR